LVVGGGGCCLKGRGCSREKRGGREGSLRRVKMGLLGQQCPYLRWKWKATRKEGEYKDGLEEQRG